MNKDTLERYVKQGLSAYQIAARENKSQTTIRYWLKKYSLKTRYVFRSGDGFTAHRTPLDVNWTEVQAAYDSGLSQRDTAKQCGIAVMTLRKAMDQGMVVKRSRQESRDIGARKAIAAQRHLTSERKHAISVKRKEYLAKTGRAPWQTSMYHKSIPCERLKQRLRDESISFAEECMPLMAEGRFFSIDIAFLDIRLGIEVNGRQHYHADGTLLPYYQERHDLIERAGWTLWEIPYGRAMSAVFVADLIMSIRQWSSRRDLNPHTPPI